MKTSLFSVRRWAKHSPLTIIISCFPGKGKRCEQSLAVLPHGSPRGRGMRTVGQGRARKSRKGASTERCWGSGASTTRSKDAARQDSGVPCRSSRTPDRAAGAGGAGHRREGNRARRVKQRTKGSSGSEAAPPNCFIAFRPAAHRSPAARLRFPLEQRLTVSVPSLSAGFPCNQFGGQEPGGVAEIKACTTEYGVRSPLPARSLPAPFSARPPRPPSMPASVRCPLPLVPSPLRCPLPLVLSPLLCCRSPPSLPHFPNHGQH